MLEKVVIGDSELWCGDCAEILRTTDIVDLVLTDPPYGIDIDRRERKNDSRRKHYISFGWDKLTPKKEVFDLILAKSRNQIIWGGNYFVDKLPYPQRCWLFWDKIQRDACQSDGELAWTSYDGKLRALSLSRVVLRNDGAVHPTQKPLRLIEWCLGIAGDISTVCDPFMGSGTTGVACVKFGHKFVGIEKERHYFDIACRRIEAAHAQGKIFQHQDKQVAYSNAEMFPYSDQVQQ